MKTPSFPRHLRLAAALSLSAACGHSQAVDFDGYLRAGPGATSRNAARACYNLGIDGGHYRLGNECDFYGEFGLTHIGQYEGVDYKARVMINQYNPGTDTGKSSAGFEQMYVEGKGFDFAPTMSFWVGKRFYGRSDVHILDTFFVQMDGVGAGVGDIDAGIGKLGLAYFSSDTGAGFGDNGVGTSRTPGNRFNADLTDIAVNPGGTLRITGTYTSGHFDDSTGKPGTTGVGLSFQHKQDLPSIGGANTLWLQFAQGSAAPNGNFGDMTAPSGTHRFRLVESPTWQIGRFGGQAVALIGQAKDGTTGQKTGELSVGGRVSYALTKNFKLLAEAGYMEKRPDGQPTQKLAKFTFGPALATGPEFFKRPELRLYVTSAKWNDAANAAAGAAGLTGLADNKTRGTSVGAQVEIWF